MEIKSVAVIGAGLMGSGIAAHVANAGVPVLLLDIVPDAARNGNDRSVVARTAIERMLKADPAPFMHPRNAKLVTPGNIEDDLEKLAGVDWIVEAVVENPQIKSDIYARVDKHRKPGSIVSSNTSTIPLNILVEGQSDAFKRDFCVTHFFNPPRYMRLLEVVKGPDTRADAVEAVSRFGDVALGKGVVACKDTPGFIANRIGTFWVETAFNAALDLGLTVEEADAVGSRPMGIPKTGVFGLMDLVGIDLSPLLAQSFLRTLPKDDAYRTIHRDSPLVTRMIAEGFTGRKGKGGFYRLNKAADGSRVKEALDLRTGQYRPSEKARLDSASVKGLKALVEHPDKGGRFAWAVLSQTLSYAADLVPDIADDIHAVDEAMRLGYAWKSGPFEMIDQLGTGWFAEKLAAEGRPIPKMLKVANGRPFYKTENGKLFFLGTGGEYQELKRPEGVLLLADIKRGSKPVAKNGSAALWDIGDGVLCLEFTSKMNALDADIMAMLGKATDLIGEGKGPHKALVIYNEGSNFSVGANLGLALFAVNIAMWPVVEEGIAQGQQAYKALKYAPFPSVAAPSGMALGGGCEILMHCSAVQAHAETYTGLVEVGVGVVPGWGGCKELIARYNANPKRPGGPMPPVAKAFEVIGTAKVSKSAAEAKELGFLRPDDGITMNRDRLLFDAKRKALALLDGYKPPEPVEIRLPGATGKAALMLAVRDFAAQGKATPHDVVVSEALATVLTGGEGADWTVPVKEDDLLDAERAAFMTLLKTPGTVARIEHMLETGKPLRN
ncbi:MAG TPA: 3-hydroxyacyl-CoA dehydrogenase/enoyl-CoA hydratase family protein [Azospirillaceae bacterium]|nr:3-hydroxyacyl-CoA dehydrogenase/enoyl-CoA hydratase family protein [Azospirillaceae bacterium]